jgi:hypothetical protein
MAGSSLPRCARAAAVCALTLSALTYSATARAEEPDGGASSQAIVEARQAMERGVSAAKRGDHEAALLEYKHALELVPNANVPYRLQGESYEAMGKYAEAVASYEAYLWSKANLRDAPQVQAKIDDLKNRYLQGSLEIECEPEGSDVRVDDELNTRGKTPLKGLVLPKGEHTLVITSEGYRPLKLTSRVVPGTVRAVQCKLEPEGSPTAPSSSASTQPSPFFAQHNEPAKPSSKPFYTAWWFWTGAAVVAGGVTAGILLTRPSSHGPPATSGGSYTFP